MSIELSGYETLVNNAVYGRGITTKDLGPCRRILILRRFTEPTEDCVVDYLQRKATDLANTHASGIGREELSRFYQGLELEILCLPREVREGLANGEPEFVEIVRKSTPACRRGKKEVAKFVDLLAGLLPDAYKPSRRDAEEWYTALFDKKMREKGFGRKWRLVMPHKNGSLPYFDELDNMLRHRVSRSDMHRVVPDKYPRDEVREVASLLYRALSDPRYIENISDVSDEGLEESSMPSVRALQMSGDAGEMPDINIIIGIRKDLERKRGRADDKSSLN